MITIKDLLDRIRWDEKEDPEAYTLFYLDRVSKRLIALRFVDIGGIEEGFMVLGEGADERRIPLHRVREVRKHDEVVWRR